MTTLHLGVLIQPYRLGGKTTGDVASILENKYGVMDAFYRVHGDDVAHAVEDSLGGALESLMMGRMIDPWAGGMRSIEERFREFISSGEAEHVGIPGTPTKAAQRGVSHRFAHPYARRSPRVSFRDTGLYMNSFRAWVERRGT